MKRIIITIALAAFSYIGYSQGVLGSDIYIKNNAGTRGYVYRIGNHLGVNDSTANVYNLAQKLKLDSLYSKINSTIAVTQSGTWNINNVSGTISLPTGAATSAKQPDFGTAGTPSGDIITIQGRTSMTPVETRVQDSVRVYATNGFGGGSSGGTSLDAVDSTNLAGINTKLGIAHDIDSSSNQYLLDIFNYQDAIYNIMNLNDSGDYYLMKIRDTLASIDQELSGASAKLTTISAVKAIYDSTRTAVAMDTAGLGAKANSATVGWQSDTVGIRQHKVTDVKIGITLDMANTAPANDKAVYVYAYPISYDGSAWDFASGGTATKPSGANSTYTIATPNNFRLLGVLSYTTADMVLTDNFILSSVFPTMPDGFGIVVVNYSGAALAASTHKLYYSLVNKTER